ncbi:MAG: TatD family hydrolase [Bacteroidales bacterium]|jgi:TatD DNase family protein|nr:TatD family hydrolase [Bacteroidales bacterium]
MREFPFIDLHTHQQKTSKPKSRSVLNILAGNPLPDDPSILCSYGIHPWQIKAGNLSYLIEKLNQEATKQQVIAIGESGLDKLIETPIKEQEAIFEIHIEIAADYSKPLIIHCVKSYSELLAMRKKYPSGAWIIHGFNGKAELARQLIGKDIKLSIGSALTKPNLNISQALNSIPLTQLFLETDEQTDFSIEEIYRQASKILKIELHSLKRQLFHNFAAHFLNKV